MTSNAHELGAAVGAWNALVRRARMADRQKLAALVISSYADTDGTGIHCGVARLAVDLGASYRTAQRYLSWLREVGLIELVREGNRRRKLSDEYRLIIGPDVMEHLEVLAPDSYDDARREVREARQRTTGRRDQASAKVTPDEPVDNSDQASPMDGVQSAGTAEDQASPKVSSKESDQAPNPVRSGVTQDVPPPTKNTSPRRSTSPADEQDLRTAVTGPRVKPGPNPISSPRPKRCDHGLTGAVRADGLPVCALCRRAVASRPDERLAPVVDLRTREVS